MMCYASHTGTKRNLAALRAAGWGLLISRESSSWKTEGFPDWVGDNGAWADFKNGRPFDEDKFERFLDWIATQTVQPRWIVLPDIVAGGKKSLALSLRYQNRCLSLAPLVLIAVQDDMEHSDLAPHIGSKVGIFLGGSTKWKLARMGDWGQFCADHNVYYHVARVNTARRFRMAHDSGALSIDGTSVTRYAVTLPELDRAARQPSLLSPRLKWGDCPGAVARVGDAIFAESGTVPPNNWLSDLIKERRAKVDSEDLPK